MSETKNNPATEKSDATLEVTLDQKTFDAATTTEKDELHPEGESFDHVITQEDLDNNPELVKEDIKVGDKITAENANIEHLPDELAKIGENTSIVTEDIKDDSKIITEEAPGELKAELDLDQDGLGNLETTEKREIPVGDNLIDEAFLEKYPELEAAGWKLGDILFNPGEGNPWINKIPSPDAITGTNEEHPRIPTKYDVEIDQAFLDANPVTPVNLGDIIPLLPVGETVVDQELLDVFDFLAEEFIVGDVFVMEQGKPYYKKPPVEKDESDTKMFADANVEAYFRKSIELIAQQAVNNGTTQLDTELFRNHVVELCNQAQFADKELAFTFASSVANEVKSGLIA